MENSTARPADAKVKLGWRALRWTGTPSAMDSRKFPDSPTGFRDLRRGIPIGSQCAFGCGPDGDPAAWVVGGMLAATIFGLALVPVFYAVIERLRDNIDATQSINPEFFDGRD